MAFRAHPQVVADGLEAQSRVLQTLRDLHHPSWDESRTILLTKLEPGKNINFEEKKMGDLHNPELSISMEVQHSERTANCLWVHSKMLHCNAEFQCFSFKLYGCFVISTVVLRDYIGFWKIKPDPGERDSYYTFGVDWLRSMGASELSEWCRKMRESCG